MNKIKMETSNRVYVNRKFNCSINVLFKWIVEPELISQWFGPKHLNIVDVKANFEVGGTYSIQLSKPDGTVFSIEGEYIEIEKPNKLKFSFRYAGLDNNPPDSFVSITLKKVRENVSELTLVQKFESIPADMENRTKAWEYMFTVLDEKIMATAEKSATHK